MVLLDAFPQLEAEEDDPGLNPAQDTNLMVANAPTKYSRYYIIDTYGPT